MYSYLFEQSQNLTMVFLLSSLSIYQFPTVPFLYSSSITQPATQLANKYLK